jgi:ferredoxin
MIFSLRSVSYDELKSQISKDDKIAIISCNGCVTACGIGGKEKLKILSRMLEADGYNVLGTDLISIACTVTLVQKHRKNPTKKDMYHDANVIIPLICENGLMAVEGVFADKKIVKIAKTLGTGNSTMKGPLLTNPFEWTKLDVSSDGYTIGDVASKLGLYDGFFNESEAAPHDLEYVTLTINGEKVTAEKGQNLLQVCKKNGIFIPHLCYNEELTEAGVCRLCLVKIKGMRDLAPSCCTHVSDGMEVITEDEELIENRKIILELIMASHHHNCLTCSKGIPNMAYACELQKLIRRYGIEGTRFIPNYEIEEKDESSPVISIDYNRCILCGQCVRACEELAGLCNIGFVNRGSKTKVVAGLNVEMDQSECAQCMACVYACPTGALKDKYVRFEGSAMKKCKLSTDEIDLSPYI